MPNLTLISDNPKPIHRETETERQLREACREYEKAVDDFLAGYHWAASAHLEDARARVKQTEGRNG